MIRRLVQWVALAAIISESTCITPEDTAESLARAPPMRGDIVVQRVKRSVGQGVQVTRRH